MAFVLLHVLLGQAASVRETLPTDAVSVTLSCVAEFHACASVCASPIGIATSLHAGAPQRERDVKNDVQSHRGSWRIHTPIDESTMRDVNGQHAARRGSCDGFIRAKESELNRASQEEIVDRHRSESVLLN